MIFDPARHKFLAATELLCELQLLRDIAECGVIGGTGADNGLTPAMVQAPLSRLTVAGMVELAPGEARHHLRLTTAGEDRLRYLSVDFAGEILSLHTSVPGLFMSRFDTLRAEGVKTVAFYPVGETAEVAFLSMQESGLELRAALDDDESKWGTEFHSVTVAPPNSLCDTHVDAVILTTCVFQGRLLRRLEGLGLKSLRTCIL